jgi:O-antigen ligase
MISLSPEPSTLSERGLFSFSPVAGINRLWQLALLLFSLTCFLEIARILDPVHMHVISVALAILAISLVASRRALIFLKCGAGRVLLPLVGWFLLAYFTAPHTELSSRYIISSIQGALLFVAGAVLFAGVADFKTFFRIVAAAGLVLCTLGIVWSGTINGRFALRGGPYIDPNTFALALLGIAPIIWVSCATKPWWIRLCGFVATAVPVLLALRTASRGGLVGILAMLVVLFFLAATRIKIVMASAAVLALVIVLAFLPDSLRTRLFSVTRIASTGERQTADTVSLSSRETMLRTSLSMTIAYPLFGVGPGNFGPTIEELGKLQGQNWINLNTHNSYTQISSETGIPGLLLYLLLIGFSFKSLITAMRRTSPHGAYPNPELHRLGAGLLVSLAATCTCMLFLSEGYSVLIFLWLGLANGAKLLLPDEPKEEDEYVEVEVEPA